MSVRTLLHPLLGTLALAVALSLGAAVPASAADPNPVTPGNFTGFGFDQCLTPEQYKMNAWLESSPYLAAGIYISGNSRACRNQPNLTPEWVRTQLAKGWRLLPITLGPQADCLRPVPALQGRPDDHPEAGQARPVQPGPQAGRRRGHQDRHGGRPARHRPGQHALVRPRGLLHHQHDLPRVRAVVPQRLDAADPPAGLRVRRLLERRVGHQDARRRARQATRRLHAARRDLAGPVGRRREHQLRLHPRRRLASGWPGQAVQGRPRRALGQHPDQHRHELPRPGQRPGRPGRGPLPRDPGELPGVPAPGAGHGGQEAGAHGRSPPSSACSARRAATPATSRASTRRSWSRPSVRGRRPTD